MAIFNQKHTQQSPGAGSTLVAASTELVGNLTLSDNLHVDGRIEGDVVSEANVVVGTQGRIEGTIKARQVMVSGQIKGSVYSERLEITKDGQLEGDVHVSELMIEPGGRFNGSSEIVGSESTSADLKTIKDKPASETAASRSEDQTAGAKAHGSGAGGAAATP